MPRTPGKLTSVWAQVGFYTSLGFILPAAALAGYGVGYWLDEQFHSKPLLAIVMAFLGGAGGFIEILRILGRWEKDAGGNNTGAGPGAR